MIVLVAQRSVAMVLRERVRGHCWREFQYRYSYYESDMSVECPSAHDLLTSKYYLDQSDTRSPILRHTSSSPTMATPHLLASSGWIFFVAENALLSENRGYLIEYLGGEGPYHNAYGLLSTLATASIGYGYYKLRHLQGSLRLRPVASLVGCSMGGILMAQALPKLQIPVGYSEGQGLNVRCPFDFSDRTRTTENELFGLERITRHPGLWSLGLVGLGQAALQSHPALRLWWSGPALVAWLGGSHQDSRFRRGMGGTLDPYYDAQTSNLPFVALLSGRQGPVGEQLIKLGNELKPLNALIAVAVAAVWVTSRGRVKL